MICMDYEQLRPIALEALKQKPETQIIAAINDIEQVAIQKGFCKDSPSWGYGGAGEHKMPREDREEAWEILNDLIIEGILGCGNNKMLRSINQLIGV